MSGLLYELIHLDLRTKLVNRKALAVIAFTLASSISAQAMDLTPDQQEQVKLKSAKWGEDRQKAEALTKAGKYQEAEAIYRKTIADRQTLGLDLFSEYDRLGALFMSWGK